MKQLSYDFSFQKYGNGVKLTRLYSHTDRTIKHAMAQNDYSFCLLNKYSEIVYMNAVGAMLNGYMSEKDVIGKSLFDLYETNNAKQLREDDVAILRSNQAKISENYLEGKNGIRKHNYILDAPLFSENNELLGIVGFSVEIGVQPIEPALNYFRELGLLAPINKPIFNGISLTPREHDCIEQLMLGKSYKQIAMTLCVSPRTIEHYMERIKSKFNVATKFQLINLILDNNY